MASHPWEEPPWHRPAWNASSTPRRSTVAHVMGQSLSPDLACCSIPNPHPMPEGSMETEQGWGSVSRLCSGVCSDPSPSGGTRFPGVCTPTPPPSSLSFVASLHFCLTNSSPPHPRLKATGSLGGRWDRVEGTPRWGTVKVPVPSLPGGYDRGQSVSGEAVDGRASPHSCHHCPFWFTSVLHPALGTALGLFLGGWHPTLPPNGLEGEITG